MMKYRTFRILRMIIIIVMIIAIIVLLSQTVCKKKPRKELVYDNKPASTKITEIPKIKYGEQELSITSIDKEILDYQKSGISTGEIDKDGESYKRIINTKDYRLELRNDIKKGFTFWNRIKVDYDKDKNWDEKWTFSKDGKIKREVSPNDNENYEYTYYLKGEQWEKK